MAEVLDDVVTEPAPEPAICADDRPEYVVGFMFSPDRQDVLLIRKNRPPWQAGKYNGLGGSIKPGELAEEAMRREFYEETGIDHADWTYYAVVTGRAGGFCVHFFHALGDISRAISTTDEEVVRVALHGLSLSGWPLVRAVSWLIHLALEGHYKLVSVVDELFD